MRKGNAFFKNFNLSFNLVGERIDSFYLMW